MLDDYKKDMDRIHAPDSLIDKTLQAIRQEEETGGPAASSPQEHVRRKKFRWYIPAAAAAAVLCAVLLLPSGNQYYWEEMPGSAMYREGTQETSSSSGSKEIELSALEYSEYIDLDCTSLIDGFELTDGSAVLIEDEDGNTEDTGIFYYTQDDTQIMVRLSESDDLVPDAMQDTRPSTIGGQEVRLARGQKDGETARCAAGEKDGIHYYMYCEAADEHTFLKAVRNFLEE